MGTRMFAIVEDMLKSVYNLNELSLSDLIEAAFEMYPVRVVCADIIAPMMCEIGSMWERGEIMVVMEHFASNVVIAKLKALLHKQNTTSNSKGPVVIVGCAPEEFHEIGALIVSFFMSLNGWKVVYLGQNVPPSDILNIVDTMDIHTVAMSASSERSLSALKLIGSHIASRAKRKKVEFMVGGRLLLCSPNLLETIPSATTRSADELYSYCPSSHPTNKDTMVRGALDGSYSLIRESYRKMRLASERRKRTQYLIDQTTTDQITDDDVESTGSGSSGGSSGGSGAWKVEKSGQDFEEEEPELSETLVKLAELGVCDMTSCGSECSSRSESTSKEITREEGECMNTKDGVGESKEETKEKEKEKEKEDTKEETKEETKEGAKGETEGETKVDTKEETKGETNVDTEEGTKEDMKEESTPTSTTSSTDTNTSSPTTNTLSSTTQSAIEDDSSITSPSNARAADSEKMDIKDRLEKQRQQTIAMKEMLKKYSHGRRAAEETIARSRAFLNENRRVSAKKKPNTPTIDPHSSQKNTPYHPSAPYIPLDGANRQIGQSRPADVKSAQPTSTTTFVHMHDAQLYTQPIGSEKDDPYYPKYTNLPKMGDTSTSSGTSTSLSDDEQETLEEGVS